MPDAGSLRRIGGKDPLAGLFFHPSLIAVAHQEHGVDDFCGPHDGGRVSEIAGHDIGARRRQLPCGLTVRLARQGLDAMSSGQQCARNRAALLAGRAGHQNVSFAGHGVCSFLFG